MHSLPIAADLVRIGMSHHTYVHGYSPRESERLADQAETLTSLLHDDTRYPAGSRVLEAGCGIGAQTASSVILLFKATARK